MNKIKFSHTYPKLWNQTSGDLICVRLIEREGVGQALINYDTLYDDNGDIEYYEQDFE